MVEKFYTTEVEPWFKDQDELIIWIGDPTRSEPFFGKILDDELAQRFQILREDGTYMSVPASFVTYEYVPSDKTEDQDS